MAIINRKLRITSPDNLVSIAPLSNLDFYEVYNSRVSDHFKYTIEEIDEKDNVIAVHYKSAKVSQMDAISEKDITIAKLERELSALKKKSKQTVEAI